MNAIYEKINDLALISMMVHEGDPLSFEMAYDLFAAISKLCVGNQAASRVEQSIAFIVSQKNKSLPEQKKLFDDFVAAAQAWQQNEATGTFPGETASALDVSPAATTLSGWETEVAEYFDAELARDFIVEHMMKLDEFEASLLPVLRGEVADPDFERATKGYLHNLKGDAATVGFRGLEQTTHAVEDAVVEFKASCIGEQLLGFREWVVNYIKAFGAGAAPSQTAAEFLNKFKAEVAKQIELVQDEAPKGAAGSTYELKGDAEILLEFTVEAEDHIQKVEEILLEKDDGFDADSVNAIFRAVHSIKGGSSYFNLEEMTRTSHKLENMLDRVRKGQLSLNHELKALVLRYLDLQRTQFQTAKAAMAGSRLMTIRPETAEFMAELEAFENGTPVSTVRTASATTAESKQEERPADSSKKDEKLDVKTFVKVDTTRLDRLIEYIGEMVISSSMLIRSCRDLLGENEGVMSNTQQLGQISREIQEIGMSMRLVPIKGLLQKMSRLVWDTSKKIGKEITFKTIGEDTELDRTVIDRLADPLMHMIRNSIDHGIEPPADREASGKPRVGTVTVEALHFGGSIHIKISDDGRGLDPDKLLKKAWERGLVPDGQRPSQQEIYQLIFAAGFSTAEKVTDISGRGVGMDVVRRNIEAMRGRVHIESELKKGTTFTIELPLTLAIIDGIETLVGDERYIIPTHSIIEFVRPKSQDITYSLDNHEVFQFRGEYLPVFRLSKLYELESRNAKIEDGVLAVVEANHQTVAILLDQVVGSYSTVIKPLGPTFQDVKGLAGCAIMPDGNIGLILDIATLVQLAGTIKPSSIKAGHSEQAQATLH